MDSKKVNLLNLYSEYLAQLFDLELDEDRNTSFVKGNQDICNEFYNLFVKKFSLFEDSGLNTDKMKSEIEREVLNIQKIIARDFKEKEELLFFKHLFEALLATVRTNYFAKDGNLDYISVKIKSGEISDVEKPYLFAEIFVYHKDFKGVHLRGEPVSRGGLRWSDRVSDFRTEIFSLVKAQILKNSVIVPSGSKGGFVITKENASKEDAIECYKTFLRGLLDITDNVVNGNIVKPNNVLCYDGDDSYLVVAADKGTASFSDYANEISNEYNFWLGDAFASGGKNGYNHKGLGITARGAWESVKWHAKESGIQVGKDVMTAVAIGSMAGDVSGNGLIYNDKIKLLGAIDSHSIFIDPNPDTKKSFNERKRLFDIGQSSGWSSYNPDAISEGGGIFSRESESIESTKEINRMFGLDEDTVKIPTSKVISMILGLDVDMVWSGGIGTLYKSSEESNALVKDKQNDAIRVDAKDIRAKFIGEGANLSITQAGRIEYNKNGGMCFMDSIDNSAGVDCSDHEVNIKILLNAAFSDNQMTKDECDELLRQVELDVVDLILSNNNRQARSLTLTSLKDYNDNVSISNKAVQFLLKNNMLDLSVYSMPSDEELSLRKIKNLGFLKPELSVLLSCTKLYLKKEFGLYKDLFSSSIFNCYLDDYFPSLIRQTCSKLIYSHQLRNEMIINTLVNEIVNTFDLDFFINIQKLTNCSVEEFIMAYILVTRSFDISSMLNTLQEVCDDIKIDQIQLIFNMLNRSVSVAIINTLKSKDLTIENFVLRKKELEEKLEKIDYKTAEESFSSVFDSSQDILSSVKIINQSFLKITNNDKIGLLKPSLITCFTKLV